MNTTNIRDVAKEIIGIEINANMTIAELLSVFYNIMRKYNIKQGTPLFDNNGKHIGTTQSNPEWIMCESLFLNRIKDSIEIRIGFGIIDGFEVPIDIRF